MRRHFNTECLEAGRDQRRRTADDDARSHLSQQVEVRTQHAAVQQVTDYRDAETGEPALPFLDREGVEQRLSRMLVRAVTGIDDARLADARELMRRARRSVSYTHLRAH